jgi:D-alanyl-D-alanine carboxypeptidase
MLCHSANDATVVFAEAISGTTAKFVDEMNAQARRLGMHNTHFANTNGLPDTTNHTTVEDMAKLARALIEDFPEYYKYFSIPSIDINGHQARNTNHLLGVDPAVDGMKTGWIQMSGFNLVASAKKGDVRVIAIVFGANTPDGRNTDMEHLLQYAFQKQKNPKALFAYGPNLAANSGGRTLPTTPQEEHAPPRLATVKPEEPKIAPAPEGGAKPDVAASPPTVAAPKPPV